MQKTNTPRRRLGVCSWSLQPETPTELSRRTRLAGLSAVQLALDPLRLGHWKLGATLDAFGESGIQVLSGMMGFEGEDYTSLESIRLTGGLRPDATWKKNRKIAQKSARLARQFEVSLVSAHAGFLPEESGDPERARLIERLREVADIFDGEGIQLALETGQESAETLLGVLRELDRPNVGVNFDPANMLLYAMGDPVSALRALGPHVLQVHVKDACVTKVPGTWGTEVPVGSGEVDWSEFFEALREVAPDVDLLIEREDGDERVADAATARKLVERLGEAKA